MADEPEIYQGGCLCGKVRYRALGPALFTAHCHCAWCRRAHGAAFVTWTGFPEGRFTLADPRAIRWFQSSSRSRRGFCPRCGTTLLFTSTSSPGEVHVAAGTFTECPPLRPGAHIFVDQAVPWLILADGLRQIPGDHPALAAYQGDPRHAPP